MPYSVPKHRRKEVGFLKLNGIRVFECAVGTALARLEKPAQGLRHRNIAGVGQIPIAARDTRRPS